MPPCKNFLLHGFAHLNFRKESARMFHEHRLRKKLAHSKHPERIQRTYRSIDTKHGGLAGMSRAHSVQLPHFNKEHDYAEDTGLPGVADECADDV
jgi:hypothetical protein